MADPINWNPTDPVPREQWNDLTPNVPTRVSQAINTTFDSKVFNPIAYGRYYEIIVNELALFKNQLIRSQALVASLQIRNLFNTQTGSYYARIPIYGRIGTEDEKYKPDNYDGMTDITQTRSYTFERGVTCFGRAKAWYELDFSYDITSGVDFLSYTAQQIATYWERQDIKTLYSIIKALFTAKSNDDLEENDDKVQFNNEYNKFVSQHTYCTITGYILKELLNRIGTLEIAYEDETALSTVIIQAIQDKLDTVITDDTVIENFTKNVEVGVETLNSAIQKASGDNKQIFTLAIAPSIVGTTLENKQLLVYYKYNDANGIIRNLNIGTWNGRTLLIDDELQSLDLGLNTNWTDTITFTVRVKATNSSTEVTEFKLFTITLSVSPNSSILTSSVVPILVLGSGMFEYENLNVKTAWEMYRRPFESGGYTSLISRRRLSFSPRGFSYVPRHQETPSPTNEELGNNDNWEIIHSASPIKQIQDGETIKNVYEFYAVRNIPLLRILCASQFTTLSEFNFVITDAVEIKDDSEEEEE